MKPNFALILSMDGIALLQRSSPGWALVGEAYPDNPDLPAEMAALRDAAERLAPGEATFKVVIPNDQIRYLSIPAGPADPRQRQQAVEAALDGTTPYALDELVIDHMVVGETLQIAAVATETLQEADEFARSFGFDPVSFVAMPEGREYTGEPFFGTAHDVPEDIEVEPDVTAIRVSGRIKPPAAPAAAPAVSAEAVATETPDAAGFAEAEAPDGETGPVSFSSVRARAMPDAAAPLAPAPAPTADRDDPQGEAPRITFAEPAAGKSPAPVVMPPRDIRPEELSDSLKSSDPEGKTPARPSPLSSLMARGSGLAAKVSASLAARRAARADARAARAEEARLKAEAEAEEAARPKLPETALGISAPNLSVVESAPAPAPEPQAAPAKGRKRKGKGKAAQEAPVLAPPPDPLTDPLTDPAPGAASSPALGPQTSDPILSPLASERRGRSGMEETRRLGALSAEERRAEEERLTVFGARNASYDTGGRGSVGLVIAVVAAVLVFGTMAWAALFSDASLSALLGRDIAQEEEVAAAPPGPVEDAFVPPAPGDDPAPEAAEEPTAEDRAVEAALQEPAPEEPTVPPAEVTEEAATETPPAEPAEDAPVSPLIVTEAADAPPAESAEASPETPPATGEESQAADEARYAASGIWQDSPNGIAATGEGTGANGTEGTVDPDAPPARNPQVDLAALQPDRRPAPPAPPPVFGQRFNMDDRGLVIATPDGALTPSGILAFAGDPPIVPPPRPGDPDPPAAETPPAEAPQEAAEPEEAPATAPASDAQLSEEPQPGAEAQPDRFALVRPRLRPGSDAAQAETADSNAATQDDVAIASGASLAGDAIRPGEDAAALIQDEDRASIAAGLASGAEAVRDGDAQADADAQSEAEAAADGIEPAFVALRPIQRPGNIEELAAAARATPEPPPAIEPSGPTRVSVARQATVRNALDLTEVNLIGVYGQPSDRRALVRLANGRYRKVKVGDRMDGGRVLAIGEDTLRYQKDGRNLTLNMPSG